MIVADFKVLVSRTDNPPPFSSEGLLPKRSHVVDGNVIYSITKNINTDITSNNYTDVTAPPITPYDVEADGTVTSTSSYTSDGGRPYKMETTMAFQIPEALCGFFDLRNRLTTMTLTVTAAMPPGGGSVTQVGWDVSTAFVSSMFSVNRPHPGNLWQLVAVGITSAWKQFRPIIRVEVDWEATSWNSGEAPYAFDLSITVNSTDPELRLDPDRLPTYEPSTVSAVVDPPSICSSFCELSLEDREIGELR